MQFDLFEIKHVARQNIQIPMFRNFQNKEGLGLGGRGPIFSIKREGLLKIGGGYFLKKGVSLIFIITSPFQC